MRLSHRTGPITGRLLVVLATAVLGGAVCLVSPAAADEIGPLGVEYPVPPPGNTRGSVWQGYPSCVDILGIQKCTATVYTSGELAGWRTTRQSQNKLHLGWKIKMGGVLKASGSAYCQGATGGISSCTRNGPSYTVSWVKSSPPQVCVDTFGYAYYIDNSNGHTTYVGSSDFDCHTMSSVPPAVAGS